MRPSLPVLLVVLALIGSALAGLYIGGGPTLWLREPLTMNGANENATLPIAPPTPTPFLETIVTGATPTVAALPPTPTSTTPPAADDDNELSLPLSVLADNLRVRVAPDSDATVITELDTGTEARAIGRNADGRWVQVEVEGVEAAGWVSADSALVELDGDVEELPVTE